MNNLLNKKLIIIFEDGDNHVSKKEGICTEDTELQIILDNKDIIPRSKIFRMEILKKSEGDIDFGN